MTIQSTEFPLFLMLVYHVLHHLVNDKLQSGPMNMVEDLSDLEWTTRRHAVFHENMDVVMETITLLNNPAI